VIEDPATGQRRTFDVRGPYVARIPAGFAHTFVNIGPQPFNLTAVFASSQPTYKEVGPNPLVRGRQAAR
jgi:oxalate decarboxylase/phosphoglucose isomerase-like protein (cupin superfamily)